MPQISKAIFAVLAASLTVGAVQFATGQEVATGQEFAGRFEAVTAPAGTDINRAAKMDRQATVPAPAPTRTISLKVDSMADTSVLVRVPVAKEARNLTPTPAPKQAPRKPDRKMAIACEPTVSVLTEVAKLLQPGRCVT
ncbi:hypothetical protein JQ628_15275 [Bradyrhizobium lablabi]|uniref:hypothetical protein n=1 Tax=Bradyrhizobium lablabi TaxID=722472 RepID=UPI001BA6DEF5|nr:hypothetical protein [Bradyrhizobium lablabi]MBR1122888.1 hypothetical protein [Bradyrhizobium lablabi]